MITWRKTSMEERIFVLFSTEECLLQETVGGQIVGWQMVCVCEADRG